MLCGVTVNPKNPPATGCNGWFVVLDIREFILAVLFRTDAAHLVRNIFIDDYLVHNPWFRNMNVLGGFDGLFHVEVLNQLLVPLSRSAFC